MGVPTFFRWVSEKYPKIVHAVVEEDEQVIGSTTVPLDATQANPNGLEFDNLYLDMNGLIHPCTHPEGREGPKTEDAMFRAIFAYVDRIFNIVRPRKVLYFAIDGVAPRAKMNQQRSRRFRSAQEVAENKEAADRLRREMVLSGSRPPPARAEDWDSNVITPGTPFMDELSRRLRHYVLQRQNHNEAWKPLKVIYSDAQSPGEGEHKIMQFIRRERATVDYNPNTRHCLYGLDADLIMLGLATHDVHFTILRERVLFGKKKQAQSHAVDPVLLSGEGNATARAKEEKKPFDFLHVWILREYLAHEFRPQAFYATLPFEYDLERCLDDFIFLCFFVGNDFLPHLPSLSIREGGLELLLDLYKRLLPTVGGYLTQDGDIFFGRVQVLMKLLGTVEDEIFRRRGENEKWLKERREQQKQRRLQYEERNTLTNKTRTVKTRARDDRPNLDVATLVPLGRGAKPPSKSANKEVAAALKRSLKTTPTPPPKKKQKSNEKEKEKKATMEDKLAAVDLSSAQVDGSRANIVAFEERMKELEKERNTDDSVVDEVRLGEEGWKERYYISKFGEQKGKDPAFRRKVVVEYVKGLLWVMQYYYKGCQSWRWYYPFHYAPFASDLVDLDDIQVSFAPSEPFSPVDQLLGVLPPSSSHALPKACYWYMHDEDSPIADFYPKEFKYDPNGKGVRWLWIALLPFVDEKRLLKVSSEIKKEMTPEENKRNELRPDLVFMHKQSKGFEAIRQNLLETNRGMGNSNKPADDETNMAVKATPTTAGDARHGARDEDADKLITAKQTEDISGYFFKLPPDLHVDLDKDIACEGDTTVANNQVACFEFQLPKMSKHLSKLLPGLRPPPKVLNDEDLRIRKPRLNRRVDVSELIAEREGYAGGASRHSQSGLSREGYSGGQRSWGSMEPKANIKRNHHSTNVANQSYVHPSYGAVRNAHQPTNSFYGAHPSYAAQNYGRSQIPLQQPAIQQQQYAYSQSQSHARAQLNPYATTFVPGQMHRQAQPPPRPQHHGAVSQAAGLTYAPRTQQNFHTPNLAGQVPRGPAQGLPLGLNQGMARATLQPTQPAGTPFSEPSLLDQIQSCLKTYAKKKS